MESQAIAMSQHILPMVFWITIDKHDNFMQFWAMMVVLFIVFNGLHLIIASILIMLFKSTYKYDIINQIFTNNNMYNSNCYQNDDDLVFVDQVGEPMIGDNRSRINATGFGNSNAVDCKATNSAHSNNLDSNNLNKKYFQLGSNALAKYYASMYSEPFFSAETDVIVNWNAMIVIWKQLLSDTTKKEAAIFTNLLIIFNLAKLKEYNVLKLYSCYSDEIKDDFETTVIEVLFEGPNIILSDREPRVECLKKTDITFNTIFRNTANDVIENETQLAHYDDLIQ